MNTEGNWRNLTLPEFIDRFCHKPLSKPLRAVVIGSNHLPSPIPKMGDLTSRSDIRILRHVGPESAGEIIAAMKKLGWRPRPTPMEISFVFATAASTLTKIAARARHLARAHPEIAADLVALARQAASQADRLKEARRELAES